jgi:hypothetical protein
MSRPPELHRKMRPAAAFVMLGGSGLRIVELSSTPCCNAT